MLKREEFEAEMYHQRRAHKVWVNKALARHELPSDEASELVWELLVTYGECADNPDQASEDIFETAHELAQMLLTKMPIEHISEIYRDCLLDAMLETADGARPEQFKTLVHFANIVSDAFRHVHSDQLRKTMRHKRTENLSSELKLAKRIQMHLLPKVIPTIPGFEFAGRLIPAEEIGGDYWSVKYQKDDDIVTLKLADITGHGVAAATLVAAVKFISGGYYQGATSASEVITKTNHVLTQETPHDILVTMIYGWLRPKTYELTLVNAGHSPVFMCRKNVCADVPPTGSVLGVTEDAQYEEETYKLAKNDIVFFGSDGITEAGMAEPFGTERLKRAVTDASAGTADQIADAVVDAVTHYSKRAHDDISLVVVKVTGDPPESD